MAEDHGASTIQELEVHQWTEGLENWKNNPDGSLDVVEAVEVVEAAVVVLVVAAVVVAATTRRRDSWACRSCSPSCQAAVACACAAAVADLGNCNHSHPKFVVVVAVVAWAGRIAFGGCTEAFL